MRDVAGEVGDGHPDLLHGVEVSQGHSVVCEGVEVDGDGEGDPALVSARIALTDRLPRVVYLGGDTGTGQQRFYGGLD